MILISVDLPAPFSPSSAWIEPPRIVDRHVLQRQHAGEGLVNAARLERDALMATPPVAACLEPHLAQPLTPTAQRISRPSTTCTKNGSIRKITSACVMMATMTTPKNVPKTLTCPPRERRAADDRARRRTGSANRRRSRAGRVAAARPASSPASAARKPDRRVRPKDRARDRNAGQFGRARIAADGEYVAPDPLAIEQAPHRQRRPARRAARARESGRRSWRCRTPSRSRGCRRTAARA